MKNLHPKKINSSKRVRLKKVNKFMKFKDNAFWKKGVRQKISESMHYRTDFYFKI